MSLTINTNLSFLIVQSSLKSSTKGLNQTIERMTTGYKINHAKDNAANYAIATQLSTKIGAYSVAEENAMMGVDMVQTASSSLDLMSDLASRLRALATQAQNGTYGDDSLEAINSEATAIVQELNRVNNTCQYNGINLLNNSVKVNTQIGTAAVSSYAAQARGLSASFVKQITRRDTSSMTTLESVDTNTKLTSGTYSISSAEELAKLATMTNSENVAAGVEFVLANDIDLSSYSDWTPIGIDDTTTFSGIFDGNGYEISNVSTTETYGGFFGAVSNATIKNLGITNFESDSVASGALCACAMDSTIDNCFARGTIVGAYYAGGLVGTVGLGTLVIKNSCTDVGVSGEYIASGLVGVTSQGVKINVENSFSQGTVSGLYAQGFIGLMLADSATVTNSYSICEVVADETSMASSGQTATATGFIKNDNSKVKISNSYFAGSLNAISTSGTCNDFASEPSNATLSNAGKITIDELYNMIESGKLPINDKLPKEPASSLGIQLQVGVGSNLTNQIVFELNPIDISALDGLNLESANSLAAIDEVLKTINAAQTNLGAIENRLTSALESIGVSYGNLVSTRSTLQDADIAQESSNYIKMQILQQASATLMATANQSPSVALQLL